jgi:hypothetical protein
VRRLYKSFGVKGLSPGVSRSQDDVRCNEAVVWTVCAVGGDTERAEKTDRNLAERMWRHITFSIVIDSWYTVAYGGRGD